MADEFDVDRAIYDVYVFACSELCERLADGEGRSEKNPLGAAAGDGCTNVLVSEPVVADDEAAGPLVLKNQDIAGRGLRPKSMVEQPPIDDYHGVLTVGTSDSV